MHETVQSAVQIHDLRARPQHQMERVAENDVGAEVFEFLRRHRLHRPVRADRHEGRSLDHSMGSREESQARSAVGRENFKRRSQGAPVTNIASP